MKSHMEVQGTEAIKTKPFQSTQDEESGCCLWRMPASEHLKSLCRKHSFKKEKKKEEKEEEKETPLGSAKPLDIFKCHGG